MKQVRTFRVYWVDSNGDGHDEYMQALNVKQAFDFLGVNPNDVVDVSIVMKDWRRQIKEANK